MAAQPAPRRVDRLPHRATRRRLRGPCSVQRLTDSMCSLHDGAERISAPRATPLAAHMDGEDAIQPETFRTLQNAPSCAAAARLFPLEDPVGDPAGDSAEDPDGDPAEDPVGDPAEDSVPA
eukprot:CAMPEP_0181195876 /NCGR_PEP_ID=MMETSP1096-20121128/15137_1 /TAXON_ID=156174 ORGANISM="Chrysochromulina ericina, Strain CCMP281" /NCGR_SAMPLE_ID=MMETSP1096 /ASSEMBLY_ACC=CAM_ASM_000453 /LENGTH=120 /DNA_ID=CAMNT_0023285541 /DNA_START=216 /DNA_END=579 /DNA_ORIENTATION=-